MWNSIRTTLIDLKNLLVKNASDLFMTSIVTIASIVMSVTGNEAATIGITATSLFLTLVVDIQQIQNKAEILNEKQRLLEDTVTPFPFITCSNPGLTKLLLLTTNSACLIAYIISASVGAGFWTTVVFLVPACTIFHLGKKFIDSPVAKQIKALDTKISSKLQSMQQTIKEKTTENEHLKQQLDELYKKYDIELRESNITIESLNTQLQQALNQKTASNTAEKDRKQSQIEPPDSKTESLLKTKAQSLFFVPPFATSSSNTSATTSSTLESILGIELSNNAATIQTAESLMEKPNYANK